MDNMTAWVSLFAAAITAGTPLLLAAQGELLTERASRNFESGCGGHDAGRCSCRIYGRSGDR